MVLQDHSSKNAQLLNRLIGGRWCFKTNSIGKQAVAAEAVGSEWKSFSFRGY